MIYSDVLRILPLPHQNMHECNVLHTADKRTESTWKSEIMSDKYKNIVIKCRLCPGQNLLFPTAISRCNLPKQLVRKCAGVKLVTRTPTSTVISTSPKQAVVAQGPDTLSWPHKTSVDESWHFPMWHVFSHKLQLSWLHRLQQMAS